MTWARVIRGISFHGKTGKPGLGQGLKRLFIAIWIHDGNDGSTLLVVLDLGIGWPAHLEHHIGGLRAGRGAEFRTRFREGFVGDLRACAGAFLNNDIQTERNHFLDGINRGGNAGFVGMGFFCDENGASQSTLP